MLGAPLTDQTGYHSPGCRERPSAPMSGGRPHNPRRVHRLHRQLTSMRASKHDLKHRMFSFCCSTGRLNTQSKEKLNSRPGCVKARKCDPEYDYAAFCRDAIGRAFVAAAELFDHALADSLTR